MQAAESIEDVHTATEQSVAVIDPGKRPDWSGSHEHNENHLSSKYQPLSWRSNGVMRSKNHLRATNSHERNQSALGSTTNWRLTNKDDHQGQWQHIDSSSEDMLLSRNDRKINTRTFEKSGLMTEGAVGGSSAALQADKGGLCSSSGREINGPGRGNHRPLTHNDKFKVTPLAHLLLSDDMRISKILRRLLFENNPAIAVDHCKKLEVAIRSPENTPYICRSFEYLTESMITVLKQCPEECAEQASTILGVIGYINRADFPIYKKYITKSYQHCKSIQKYLMKALQATFRCDATNLNLIVYSERLLGQLKDYLENADKAENFIAVSDTIAEFSKNYKRSFQKHFTDIVDIVVGWHLELEQPHSLKLHCANILQQLSQYFVQEIDFSFGLLGQFLEDIASLSDKSQLGVGSFVGAFNSIVKSLATPHEFIAFTMGRSVMQQSVHIITRATKQCLSQMLCEDAILNCNEFFCLIFANDFEAINISDVVDIIALEIKQFNAYDEEQVASLLLLMLSIIRRLRTSTPISLVTLILSTTDNPLANLKFCSHNNNFRLLLKIYHEILMLKNVPLLQEAYRHIIQEINVCISVLRAEDVTDNDVFSKAQAECILNFYLSALSVLATQTSSIIGMYALDPSILELLIVNCEASNMQLWARHTSLHSALLQLLSVHCQKNHNYRLSSLLLQRSRFFGTHALDDANSNSPTSQNFGLILEFLSEIVGQSSFIAQYNFSILLKWTENLLEECKEHAQALEQHPHFVGICKAVCTSSLGAPSECAPCLQVLLSYPVLSRDTLLCMREVAVILIDSVDPEISELYTTIFAKLPLSISLDFTRPSSTTAIAQHKSEIQEMAQWYTSKSYAAPLRDKYFKPYLDALSIVNPKSSSADENPFHKSLTELTEEIFARTWVAQQRENCAAYQKAASCTSHLLTSWLQNEAARYCVRNKLRTTIGKPQETFLRIEAIIMEYARVLAMKTSLSGEEASLENVTLIQSRARNLLGFLETLEKHIYNAAEGTAFALPALEKPAKTFFRVNASTCNEWFKRIRTAVDLIAIHSMEPAMVVRYSEVILKSLCSSGKYNELLMDHTIMSLAWALLRCRESDSLQGLYNWAKEKTGKRYMWIKYVAEQAAGHKEQAADGYLYMLNEKDSRLDAYIKEFLTDQLLDCLYYTEQWPQLREVLTSTQSVKRETIIASCTPNSDLLDAMEVLSCSYDQPAFNEKINSSLHKLMQWTDSSEDECNSDADKTNFSYYKTLQRLESCCLVEAVQTESGVAARLKTDVVKSLHRGLQECFQQQNSATASYIPEHLTDFIILNHVAQKQLDFSAIGEDTLATNSFECSEVMPQSTVLLKCLRWSRIFELRVGAKQSSRLNYSMVLDTAASARREGNSKLCVAELTHFFTLKGFRESLVEISNKVQNQELIVNIRDGDLLRGYSELAKCIHASSSNQQEAIDLAAACCSQIIRQVVATPEMPYPATSAKMLLTLSEWLLQCGSTAVSSTQLQSLLSNIDDISDPLPDVNIGEVMSAYDMCMGKLIQASILQNAAAGRAWCAFGNWCYRWGKKLVESKVDGKSAHKAGLSQRDLDHIKDNLQGVPDAESVLEDIVAILNRHQVNVYGGDEDIEASEISSTELIESQLRGIKALSAMPAHTFTAIIRTWRQAHKSIYTYYDLAAEAYFKYLCIETDGKGGKQSAGTEDSSLVTTTLRLLRLVVKHAFGLQEVLEEGLSNTPTRPWRVIIPQLFSRLNHHEPYVRKRVSELLCRIAEDKPHLIIFPAVVGAQQELKRVQAPDDSTAGDPEEPFAGRESEDKSAPLSTCFNALLSTLANQASETVQQVQLLVQELKRVTLLWDEYWIHSLAQLYSEYAPLFNAFEAEAKKATESCLDTVRAKHAILMRHMTADLRKIATVTERPAETNYERSFQERYGAFIQETIRELEEQPLNMEKTNESWQRIKHLYAVFQQRALRTSASSLKMSDISPILANMRYTSISMPGVESVDRQPVYIKAVDNTVYILPTKTKPKKLAFFGSDGRKYTYLFKGFEDLHLDERIMQFLSISNSMMARSNDPVGSSNCYRAHHYSVIPLGPQSGLISWVDGVTPLFSIYKKWQQREALVKQQQKDRLQDSHQVVQQSTSLPPAAMRPSELFYSKLAPLLAEQNIKITDTRRHWPLSILRRVLKELSEETPRDLLAKELWCHASNAADWRRSVRNYSLSVAVMSVIGYVIGLGDRHLDNVLVNLSSGEIVHIDYNVCFEKGKTLRVPEKVPFRMTPNLEEALGITGVEGAFRLGCEHVLKILRRERETLLTLLEAFVYDPLVDWAVGDDGTTTSSHTTNALAAAADMAALKMTTAAEDSHVEDGYKRSRHDNSLQRKCADAHVTRNTIGLRCNELKPFWMQYKEEATAKLQEILSHIKALQKNHQDIQHAEQERDHLTKQMAMIRELETLGTAMGSHPLNTISQRYAAYKKSAKEFNCIKQRLSKCYSELHASADTYFDRLLDTSPNSELANLRLQLSEHQQSTCANEFELVRELLEQSAQEQLYSKSDFARKEMDNTLYQQVRMAMECLDAMLQYADIMRFYPRSQLIQNRVVQYTQWYRDLLDEECEGSALKEELQRYVDEESYVDAVEKSRALQYSNAMKELWIELNFDLHKSVSFLGEQQQQVTAPVESAVSSVEAFIASDAVNNTHALQLAMVETISTTIDSFIAFEESSLNQHDDESFILDQQIDYIDMLLTMYHTVFGDAPAPTQSFAALETLQAGLQAQQKLKQAFHVYIPERIISFFMMNDDEELQSCLEMLCSSSGGREGYQKVLASVQHEDLQHLLVEIEELFDECETHLNNLSEVMQDILNQTPDGRIKQFVLSIYCYDFDPLGEKCETISKVFRTAQSLAAALQSNDVELMYDTRLMNAPIVGFLSCIQQCFVTGLTSLMASALQQSLQRTVCSAPNAMQTHSDRAATLLNAKTLCQNLFVALQQSCTIKHLQLQVCDKTKLVDHYTRVATAHFWANERYLEDSQTIYGHVVQKEKLLSSVQNSSQSLSVWKLTMAKIQAEIEDDVAIIAQRLKWAAGANRNLSTLQDAFHSCVREQNARYRSHLDSALKLIEFANVLLQFELLQSYRNSSAVAEADRAFVAAVTQWQDSLNSFRQLSSMITHVEQSLVQLLDPEGKVDHCWISNISGLLDEMTFAVQRQLVELERTAQQIQENIYESGQRVQTLMNNTLRNDIRHLLKSILKVDSLNHQITAEKYISPISARIREFQHSHKKFYAQLNDLQMKIISRDFAEQMLRQLEHQITSILQIMEDNYVDLFDLVQSFIQNDFSGSSPARFIRSAAQSQSSASINVVEKRAVINQHEQKRNAYAVSVWKRIRMKLEGRDPDPNRRCTVSEQVDFVIREATKPDNLAVLYEGWTPWV